MVQPLWRAVWRFLKRLKIELPYDPAIPLLGIHPEEIIFEKIHAPQCSLQHYLQQLRHGSNLNVHQLRMDKEDVHIYKGILAIKKNEIIFFAIVCTDLEISIHKPRDYHTELSQSENNKNLMILLKCGTYFLK